MILFSDSEGPDQTVRVHLADLSLRCPHMPGDPFRMARPNIVMRLFDVVSWRFIWRRMFLTGIYYTNGVDPERHCQCGRIRSFLFAERKHWTYKKTSINAFGKSHVFHDHFFFFFFFFFLPNVVMSKVRLYSWCEYRFWDRQKIRSTTEYLVANRSLLRNHGNIKLLDKFTLAVLHTWMHRKMHRKLRKHVSQSSDYPHLDLASCF